MISVAPNVANSEEQLRGAIQSLEPEELTLLIRYCLEGARQAELGREIAKSQTCVSFRLRRLAARLKSDGIIVALPGKGRRAIAMKVVDPAHLNTLFAGENYIEGTQVWSGRWVKGKNVGRREDDDAAPMKRRPWRR